MGKKVTAITDEGRPLSEAVPYIGAVDVAQSEHRIPHGRGGARNRLSLASSTLSLRQCQSIWAAVHFSLVVGMPLNRFITINWTTAKVENVAQALATYLHRAGDWLRDRSVGLARGATSCGPTATCRPTRLSSTSPRT